MTWNASPPLTATPRSIRNARLLRRKLTEPQRRLWWHLRTRIPVASSHFRRQVALGSYVSDFCCLTARLVVEVDGDQYGRDADAAYDARRVAALEAQGFRVLRFGNAEVMRDIGIVLDTIFASLPPPGASVGQAAHPAADPPGGTTPTSNSSPQGGGEFAEF